MGSQRGSALILVGTLERVVATLANWELSSVKDKEAQDQINGFFWTYEMFADHQRVLDPIILLYNKPPSTSVRVRLFA